MYHWYVAASLRDQQWNCRSGLPHQVPYRVVSLNVVYCETYDKTTQSGETYRVDKTETRDLIIPGFGDNKRAETH
jgi:hypothetical protein